MELSFPASVVGPGSSDLVVSKGDVLEVYTLQGNRGASSAQLRLVAKEALFGRMDDVCAVRARGAAMDSIAMVSGEGRLSLVAFDPQQHGLRTVEIREPDGEAMRKRKPHLPMKRIPRPMVCADPDRRCIACLVLDSEILVYPITSKNNTTSLGAEPVRIDLEEAGVRSVVDVCFLGGYGSPTLLVLHEQRPTTVGRLAVARHTRALLTLSLDMHTGTWQSICRVASIPAGARRLQPIPKPVYGAFVFGANAVLHFDYQNVDYCLSLNEAGDGYTHLRPTRSETVTSLELSTSAFLSPTRLLVSGSKGALFLLSLAAQGQAARSLRLDRVGTTVTTQSLSLMSTAAGPSMYAFFGSRLGDSVLARVQLKNLSAGDAKVASAGKGNGDAKGPGVDESKEKGGNEDPSPPEKRPALSSGEDTAAAQAGDDGDDLKDSDFEMLLNEIDLGAGDGAAQDADAEGASQTVDVTTCQTFVNFGPVNEMIAATPDTASTVSLAAAQKTMSADESAPKPNASAQKKLQTTLVAACGVAPEGRLCLISRGVCPRVARPATDLGLEAPPLACWPLRTQRGKRKRAAPGANPLARDTHVVVTSSNATRVLSVRRSLQPTTHTAFALGCRTLAVCGAGAVLAQVTATEIRLIDAERAKACLATVSPRTSGQSQADQTSAGFSLCAAASPYLVLGEASDGTLSLVEIPQTTDSAREAKVQAQPFAPDALSTGGARVLAVSLYEHHDYGDKLFVRLTASEVRAAAEVSAGMAGKKGVGGDGGAGGGDGLEDLLYGGEPEGTGAAPSDAAKSSGSAMDVVDDDAAEAGGGDDDLEMLLYGGSIDGGDAKNDDKSKTVAADADGVATADMAKAADAAPVEEIRESRVTVAAVSLDDGSLAVVSVPDGALLFRDTGFARGRSVLTGADDDADAKNEAGDSGFISDLWFGSLSPNAPPTLLAFLQNGDLIAYTAYRCTAACRADRAPLGFRRLDLGVITRPLAAETEAASAGGTTAALNNKWTLDTRFSPFSNVDGRSGVVVGGHHPLLVVHEGGATRAHPLLLDTSAETPDAKPGDVKQREVLLRSRRFQSGISAAAALDAEGFESSLIVLSVDGSMTVLHIDYPYGPELRLGANLTSRSIPLGERTPHRIVLHGPSNAYCALMSEDVTFTGLIEPTARSVRAKTKKFSVAAFEAPTWREAQLFSDFEEHEHVVCMRCVMISQRTFLALGTSKAKGEDAQARGRIILLEVYFDHSTVQTDDDDKKSASTGPLRVRDYSQKALGAVTAVEAIDDMLLVGVGAKVMLYQWESKNRKLTGKAFVDTQSFIVGARVLEKYMLIADVRKGLQLFAWDRKMRQIRPLARDRDWTRVFALDWAVDGGALRFVVVDSEGRVELCYYDPSHAKYPRRVLVAASTRLGSTASATAMLRAPRLPLTVREFGAAVRRGAGPPVRSVTYMATRSGAFDVVTAVDDLVYRRLQRLHRFMTFRVPTGAGFNPIEFRQPRPVPCERDEGTKAVVDVDLLARFAALDATTQRELAAMIATKPATVLENLLKLQLTTALCQQ